MNFANLESKLSTRKIPLVVCKPEDTDSILAAKEAFDPTKHEAIRQIETENPDEDHTIASVERSGYKLGDTIIRPAQVTIRSYN